LDSLELKGYFMASINAGNIAKGMFLIYKNAPHIVTKTEFMSPGKGSAVMRVRFKNAQTGSVQDYTYKTSEQVEIAEVEKKEMQFLYTDGDDVHFMDPRSYEQASVPATLLEDQIGYLIADLKCTVLWYEDRAIGVSLPKHVTMKVTEAYDAVAGNRVNAPKKPVTLETGINVHVPLFIKTGDLVVIDTTTGEYLQRA
jgi:elongation factor P